jgi:hypothetical protein
VKVFRWIVALLGLWEFGDIAALFIFRLERVPAPIWNHVITGGILIILGTWAALTRKRSTARTLDGIAAGAGAWLMLSRFILGAALPAALWNDAIVGALILILGVWSAIETSRDARSL